jgi:hypothetical protein
LHLSFCPSVPLSLCPYTSQQLASC